MAALSVRNPTLLDWTKSLDPNGKVAAVAELLAQTNEVLDDMTFLEGNLPTGHRSVIRTGLPTVTWRKLYGGVQPSKSRRVQVTDDTGMLEAYAEIDKKLAELNGNTAAFRLQEDMAFIEAMSQEAAQTVFYGNGGTEPEAFTGLAPRYNSLSAANAENIIVGGSADTDNNSIWLIVWGPNTIHGIFPKGLVSGLEVTDKGIVTIEDASDGSNTGRMEAYRTHYSWNMGLVVRDWRYAVRIPNIELSALTKDASTGPDLPDLMFQAVDKIPNLGMGRPVFYMSRTVRTAWRRQMANKRINSTMQISEVGGVKNLAAFQEIPVKRCDALAGSEALVS